MTQPNTFCAFQAAVLDHVQEHIPTNTVTMQAMTVAPGKEAYVMVLDGNVVLSTVMDLYHAFRSAQSLAYLSGPLFNMLRQPGYSMDHAVMAVSHALVRRLFETFPGLDAQVAEFNDRLDHAFADLTDGMASAMFEGLNRNRRRGTGWKNDGVRGLLNHLEDEVRELRQVAESVLTSQGEDMPEYLMPDEVRAAIRNEAADVASLAAMVADNLGALPPPAPEEVETVAFDPTQHNTFARGRGYVETPFGPIFP